MTTAAVGSYSLALAVLAASGGILAGISAVRFDSERLVRVARRAIYAAAAFLTLAAGALAAAILSDDCRLAYVARYSERALPAGYKLAAIWAGQEGALLLWAWLLAVMASIAIVTRRKEPAAHQAPGLCILAAACGFFGALMLFAANPFALGTTVPADGHGLNPMLQDPAMIAHPPVLFLGYAGLTIPFAYVLGALLAGRTDSRWITSARRWVLGSWVFLTGGILLGAQWAYVELGWGGYWGWDPVENASLLPWFTGTALLHSLTVFQRRGMLKIWSAALAALTFLLCIFATYLTRSGVIASVHAFPESPVGRFFLAMLVVTLLGSVGVILWRRKLLTSERRLARLWSVESAFLAANVLLVLMMLATAVGTTYPILSKPFAAHPVTLGPGFYNKVVVPMALVLAGLMALGPVLANDPAGLSARRLIAPGVGAILAAATAASMGGKSWWMFASAAICGFTVVAIGEDFVRTTFHRLRARRQPAVAAIFQALRVTLRRHGGQLAHLGMAAIVVAVAASSLYTAKRTLNLQLGQSERVGRYALTMESLEKVEKANYIAVAAKLRLSGPGGAESLLEPQRRKYYKSDSLNSEVAIRSGLREDVYLTLAGWTDDGETTTVQAILNPLVLWIWIGGCAVIAGGLTALVRLRGFSRQRPAAEGDSGGPSASAAEIDA